MEPKSAKFKKLAKEIAEARKQVKEGKVYTQEEVMEELGLN